MEGRPKTDSKSLLYSIDALHEAINNGKMVEFLYRKADSREKEKRIVSPWQLAWETGATTSLRLPMKRASAIIGWTR